MTGRESGIAWRRNYLVETAPALAGSYQVIIHVEAMPDQAWIGMEGVVEVDGEPFPGDLLLDGVGARAAVPEVATLRGWILTAVGAAERLARTVRGGESAWFYRGQLEELEEALEMLRRQHL